MDSLLGAAQSRYDGVTANTHQKANRDWKNWLQYMDNCDLQDDVYLENFERPIQHKILGGYAQRVREKTYSAPGASKNDQLVAATCTSAVSGVCAAFRDAGKPNPSLDQDGKLAFVLSRQWKGYRNRDPSARPQKAIPLDLLKEMVSRPCHNNANVAFHQLIKMAFFFAMRSCEYLKVTGERRTDALRVRNFVFRKNQRIMDHSDPNLECADTVTLTFEFQKRDQRDDAVTQSKTKDAIMCPVKAAAALIQRLRAEGATPDTHIYRYKDNRGKMKDLTGTVGLAILRDFVKNVDKSYGIPAGEVGLHSLRSSAAMAMYMNGVPVYTIMLLGRWSSDAFLRYIRKQVSEFSNNVSELMIKNGTYHHIQLASREDPRSHNSMSAAANSGMGRNGTDINRNAFSVWG